MSWHVLNLFFILSFTQIHGNPMIQQVSGVEYTVPRIWLTVSSVVDILNGTLSSNYNATNSSVVRALELHWRAGPNGPSVGDVLEVYRLDSSSVPIRSYSLTNQTYIKTDIEFPYHTEAELDSWISRANQKKNPYTTKHGQLSPQCLHYYAVYESVTRNQTEAIACVQLNPRWMERDFGILKNKTLEEIVIPGTHDATSFDAYNISFYETDWTGRFQFTQDENLYSQLAYGIRYFDMRVAAYNESEDSVSMNETFWMVHGPWRNHISLREAFRQIRRFLDRTTHELVIVDFHGFENGFLKETDEVMLKLRLRNFYQVVVEELEKYLIPYEANRRATIEDMVHSGRRIVMGYFYKRDPRKLFDLDLLWPNVEHLWASTDAFDKLDSYMSEKICSRNHSESRAGVGIHLQSMQAELTPTLTGKITLRYHGLRELAELVNQHFDHWFRQLYWSCANIVSPDFFLGSDVVQIAIDVNRKRFANQTVYSSTVVVH